MITHYLKFASEAEAIERLACYRDADGWIAASHSHALDVIGTITTPAVLDADGNVVSPPVTLDGYHVNLRGRLPDGCAANVVTPATPQRVFA